MRNKASAILGILAAGIVTFAVTNNLPERKQGLESKVHSEPQMTLPITNETSEGGLGVYKIDLKDRLTPGKYEVWTETPNVCMLVGKCELETGDKLILIRKGKLQQDDKITESGEQEAQVNNPGQRYFTDYILKKTNSQGETEWYQVVPKPGRTMDEVMDYKGHLNPEEADSDDKPYIIKRVD